MSGEPGSGPTLTATPTADDPSRRSTPITCRECDAVFPLAEGNCPECGTSVRSRLSLATVVVAGVAVIAISTVPGDRLSGFVGLILVGVGIAGARDRRRRIREARARRRSASRSTE